MVDIMRRQAKSSRVSPVLSRLLEYHPEPQRASSGVPTAGVAQM